MISAELVRLNGRVQAVKVVAEKEHFLKKEDIMPMFNWTRDDVLENSRDNGQTIYESLALGMMLIYQHRWLSRKATLITPLEVLESVESLLVHIANYISQKHPEARINIMEIEGVEKLRAKAHQLYPDQR
jgi:hypothetical protein